MIIGLRDVTLRDGLQDENPISTDAKVRIFDAITSAGVREIEVTSFVRGDRVPALADADDFVAAVRARRDDIRMWALVLNAKGMERAFAAGLTDIQYVLSVSESHNRENAGRSVGESLEALAGIHGLVAERGGHLELTLATAFGCPFAGPVDPDLVRGVAERAAGVGVTRISVADTIGTALPGEVEALVRRLRSDLGPIDLGVHLHDTRGLAIANAFAATTAGVNRIDGALGSLGGCPFAPGASGNLPLEDLVHVLDESGVDTGISVEGLIDAARLAASLVGRTADSHLAVAGRRFAGTPWAAQHRPSAPVAVPAAS